MYLRLSLAVMLLAVPGIASANPVKIAVVPGIAVNLDSARVDALSQDLAEALSTELEVEALGGLEVRRRLPIAGLPPDCVANQACITDVARRLDVQQLLFVVMVDTGTGGVIQVDSTWVDPAARKIVPRPVIDLPTLAEAKPRFVSAARQLLPDAPVRAEPYAGDPERRSAPIPRHFTMPSYLTAGASVAGLGVGISLGILTRGKFKDCEAMATSGAGCTSDRKDSIRTTALVADAGWLLALGGAITTAVLYATSSESSHVVVEPAPHGVSVSAVGSF
jgi:hypothetical protein